MSKLMRPFSVLVLYAQMTGLQVLGLIASLLTFTTLMHCRHAGHTIDPSLCSNINYLELFTILIAIRCWGPQWLDKRVSPLGYLSQFDRLTRLVSAAASASSTLATCCSQWRVFPCFCSEFGLTPIPAFIHLSSYCKYSM